MTEIQTVTQYQKIMARIEDQFSNSDVPLDVKMFYLLASVIALQSFKRFYQRYGAVEIDQDFAEAGKIEWLNLGPLTNFERESCALWHRFCAETERNLDQRNMYLAPPSQY